MIPPKGHQTVYADINKQYADKNVNTMMMSGIYHLQTEHGTISLSVKDLLDLSNAGRLPKINRDMLIKLDQLQQPNTLAVIVETMATSFITALSLSGFDVKYTAVTGNTPVNIDISIDEEDHDSLFCLMESFYETIEDIYRVLRELSYDDFYFQNHLILDASSRVSCPEDMSVWYYRSRDHDMIPIEKEEIVQIQDSLSSILNDGYSDTVAIMEDISKTVPKAKLDNYHKTMNDYRVMMSRQLADLKMMLLENSCKVINIKSYMEKHFDAFVAFNKQA